MHATFRATAERRPRKGGQQKRGGGGKSLLQLIKKNVFVLKSGVRAIRGGGLQEKHPWPPPPRARGAAPPKAPRGANKKPPQKAGGRFSRARGRCSPRGAPEGRAAPRAKQPGPTRRGIYYYFFGKKEGVLCSRSENPYRGGQEEKKHWTSAMRRPWRRCAAWSHSRLTITRSIRISWRW